MKEKSGKFFKSKIFYVYLTIIGVMILLFVYLAISGNIKSENGFEYTVNNNEAQLDRIKKTDADIVIPDELGGYPVTSIGYLGKNSTTTSVILPQSVKHIESRAFYNFSALAEIRVKDGITSIGESAFYGTPWFTSQKSGLIILDGKYIIDYTGSETDIIAPVGVKLVADRAFYGKEIVSFDSGECEYIGINAFNGCKKLNSVTLNDGLINIGDKAFENCSAIPAVVIPSTCKAIERNAFYSCTSLENAVIPGEVMLYSTSFGETPFLRHKTEDFVVLGDCVLVKYNGESTILEIPSGIKYISDGVFKENPKLISVTIPEGVIDIGIYAFKDCTGIQSVEFPSTIKRVGISAFENCSIMKTDTFPEEAEIGIYAFYNTDYESGTTKFIGAGIIIATVAMIIGVTAYMFSRVGKMKKKKSDMLK